MKKYMIVKFTKFLNWKHENDACTTNMQYNNHQPGFKTWQTCSKTARYSPEQGDHDRGHLDPSSPPGSLVPAVREDLVQTEQYNLN